MKELPDRFRQAVPRCVSPFRMVQEVKRHAIHKEKSYNTRRSEKKC